MSRFTSTEKDKTMSKNGILFIEVILLLFVFFQAEDGIRDIGVTGVQTCALPIWPPPRERAHRSPGRTPPSARSRRGPARPGPTGARWRRGPAGSPRPRRPGPSRPDRKSVV